jgi:hypothetical protein
LEVGTTASLEKCGFSAQIAFDQSPITRWPEPLRKA